MHILHDGRDVDSCSALRYIERTERVLAEINDGGDGRNFRIASGGGRMKITMDRYGADWAMVEKGYRAHTFGEGRAFSSATEAVETMYAEAKDAGRDISDQNLAEFVVVGDDGEPVGTMVDGDAVVMFNFRGDRAIEISQAYDDEEFDHFDRTDGGRDRPDVYYAGMLEYDGDLHVPTNYLVDPPEIDRTISHYLCAEGVKSFAVSETQKYGHVTYFWNGNRSGYIDKSLETYIEIPSDNVEFDETPAMKVREITAEVIDLLRSGDYRFGRLNFPSGDMVGHTGNLAATVEAMTVIDECMAELTDRDRGTRRRPRLHRRSRQRRHHVHREGRRADDQDVTHAEPGAVRDLRPELRRRVPHGGARRRRPRQRRRDAPQPARFRSSRRLPPEPHRVLSRSAKKPPVQRAGGLFM